MGLAVHSTGYDLSWIDEALLECEAASLPPLGGHRGVFGAGEWVHLTAAHMRSEAAQRSRGGL